MLDAAVVFLLLLFLVEAGILSWHPKSKLFGPFLEEDLMVWF